MRDGADGVEAGPAPREARARVHAEAGAARSQGQEAAPRVQHLRRRGRRRAGQRPQGARQGQEGVGRGLQARARLLRRPPRRPARHRRHRDRAERVQGLPEPRGRLLGRLPGLLVDLPPPRPGALRLLARRRPRARARGRPPVVHADGGARYRSGAWRGLCDAAGATRSMSRRGTCPDNARAEGFFGTIKQESPYSRE